jgi:hypothetical protein
MISQADMDPLFETVILEKAQAPFPPQIQSVPTIVSGQKMLCGTDAFSWLENEIKNQVTNYDFGTSGGLGFSAIEDQDQRGIYTQLYTQI